MTGEEGHFVVHVTGRQAARARNTLLYTLRDIVQNPRDTSTTPLSGDVGRIEGTEIRLEPQVTQEQLKLAIDQHNKHYRNRITITYDYEEPQQPKKKAQASPLEARAEDLSRQIAASQRTITSMQGKETQYQGRIAELEQMLSDQTSRVHALQQEAATRRHSRPAKKELPTSHYELMVSYLLRAEPGLNKTFDMLGMRFTERVDLEQALRNLNDILPEAVRTKEEALRAISAIRVTDALYDAKFPDSRSAYDSAIERMAHLGSLTQRELRDLGSSSAKREQALQEPRRILASYQKERAAWIQNAIKQLPTIRNQFRQDDHDATIAFEIKQAGHTKEVPVYLTVGAVNGSYVLEVHAPAAGGTRLLDALFDSGIFGETAKAILSGRELKQERKSSATASVRLEMPKGEYSLQDVRSVRDAVEQTLVKSYERTVLSKVAPLKRTIEDTLSYEGLVIQPSASQTAAISTVSTTEDESLPPQTPYVSKIGSAATAVLALLREQPIGAYSDSRTLADLLSHQTASPVLRSRVSSALGDLRRQGLVESTGETNRTMRYRAAEQGSENPIPSVVEQEALQPVHVPVQHDEASPLHGSYVAHPGSIAETLLQVLREHTGEGRYLGREDLLTLVNAQLDVPVRSNSLSKSLSRFKSRDMVESRGETNRTMQYRAVEQASDTTTRRQFPKTLGHEITVLSYLSDHEAHRASRQDIIKQAGIPGTHGVVHTTLERLVQKGMVTREQKGASIFYALNMGVLRAVRSEQIRTALDDIIPAFSGELTPGTILPLVQQHPALTVSVGIRHVEQQLIKYKQ